MSWPAPDLEALRFLVAFALATVTAVWVDRQAERRGLLPPGFETSWRRIAGSVALAFTLFFAVFASATTLGQQPEPLLEELTPGQLLGGPIFLLGGCLAWVLLAYTGELGAASALGLRAKNLWRELGLGVPAGIGSWLAVLATSALLSVVLALFVGDELQGQLLRPSPTIVWMAALPALWKLAISLGAGISEEIFFRGLLQKRVGIAFSTFLFVLGHVSYGQPLMLAILVVLSLIYATLTHLRGNVWAAVVAHTVFDAVQLLVVIPAALEVSGR